MSSVPRVGLLTLTLFATPPIPAAGGISCHIHPPGSTPEQPVGIIGPFDSLAACEDARQRRFGPGGRCHCAADFSPRWLTPPDQELPGQSPIG
jgi:hypothetical protein